MGIFNKIKNAVVKSLLGRNIDFHQKNFLWSTRNMPFFNTKDFVVSKQNFLELYEGNADISGAVKKIANNVSKNGLYLEDHKGNQLKDKSGDLEISRFFKTPTFQDFKRDIFRNYLITGELYIVPSFNLYGEVAGFQVLDSRMMTKMYDQYGNIIQFIQSSFISGQIIKYDPHQIAYFLYDKSLYNEHDGRSILTGLMYDVLNDLNAVRSNYFYYKNSAVPSAILLLNESMTEEEMQNAKDQFDAQYKGLENSHKMLIGAGVSDIKTLSFSPRDMDTVAQRKITTEKVAAAFWVPKSVLWYSDDVNYNNGDNNSREFYKGTIYPMESTFEHILNMLTEMFLPEIAEQYVIKCDGEVIPFSEEYLESQRKDLASGIKTINEIRIDRGMEASKEENADKLIISRNMVLLEDASLDAVLSPDEV